MSLKVLHVLDHSVPLQSGYVFRTLAILREQRRLGIDTVQVTSPKHYASKLDEESYDGFKFYRTRPDPSFLRKASVANQVMIVVDTARRLREVVASERPDLIHAHSPALNGMAALRVGKELGIPVLYEMRASWEDAAVDHGTTSEGSIRYRLSRAIETSVFRRAAAITCICEGLRKDILVRGIDPARLTVIPNAVDIENFPLIERPDEELRQKLSLGAGPVIGFIGSFYGYEGLDVLLSAVPRLKSELPGLVVLLVGGGPCEAALKEQAAALSISDCIRFAGRVSHSEVQRFYSVIDVLVYPRHSIRLTEIVTPLKPLEAMAQGRLYVASDVGGHRELVPEALRGHLFRPGDPADLAQVLTSVLKNKGTWAEVIRVGRAFVERERTWASSVQRYLPVYSGVMESEGTNGTRRRSAA
jgi:PEP-CTERM/exosortase A-associated glycosyltransferase